jgi:nucleoside-diphosphate-sugar epimerase
VQFIDARDLARWMIGLAAEGPGGPINATGPATPLTMGDLLDRMISAIGSNCRLRWIDSASLVSEAVQPWTELPLWLPDPEYAGLPQANIRRALDADLDLRPVEQTAVDTLPWAHTAGAQRETLSREREKELLAKSA